MASRSAVMWARAAAGSAAKYARSRASGAALPPVDFPVVDFLVLVRIRSSFRSEL
jgi:hypothetical protein